MLTPIILLTIANTLQEVRGKSEVCEEHKNVYGCDYGKKWMFYLDDNGYSHYINMSLSTKKGKGKDDDLRELCARDTKTDAHFFLFTRRNRKKPEPIYELGGRLESEFFNKNTCTKIITHGWKGRADLDWLLDLKNLYLDKNDYNIILYGWQCVANNVFYPFSVCKACHVAAELSKLLKSLKKTYKYTGNKVHLIGHGLGAHLMGIAARQSKLNISRITGLDPARPLFELPKRHRKFLLDKSDANFVDIIHTCGGMLGYSGCHGHADFYPHEGTSPQPGCICGDQQTKESCSHWRAVDYFLESVNGTTKFMAYPCENWCPFKRGECKKDPTEMGESASRNKHGRFYLNVNPNSPYAKGNG